MSYRKKHIRSKIHGIKPRKSIFKKLWFWIVILLLAVILTGIYFACFYSGFQVKDVSISGNDKIKAQDLEELVFRDINIELINFWNIKIVSKSIFLVNEEKIKKDILNKFPILERVNVVKNFPQTLAFNIIERKPFGVFCSTLAKGQNKECFFIDQNGVIFDSLSEIPDNFLVVRFSSGGGELYAGKKVVADNIMNAISKIQKSMKSSFQIDLKEALIESFSKLNINTNENWKVYFDLSPNYDINLQIAKLETLLSIEITLAERGNLRYIDLRPKDRAIICDNNICGG